MPAKIVLGFCITVKAERELKALCQMEKVQYKAVSSAGYKKTLGSLAGVKGIPVISPEGREGKEPAEPMLVFSGFTQEELFGFTGKMKERNMEPVALKAMITMTNVFWTPMMLYEEIAREHNQMKALERKG